MTRFAAVVFAVSSVAVVSMASAAIVPVQVKLTSDVASEAEFGSPKNFRATVNLATVAGLESSVTLVGLNYDSKLETAGDSWLTELRVHISNQSLTEAVDLVPARSQNRPSVGVESFVGAPTYFADKGLPEIELSNGVVALEFFDAVDDNAAAADGYWRAGSVLTFFVEGTVAKPVQVPEPAGLAVVATVGAGLLARRRRTVN